MMPSPSQIICAINIDMMVILAAVADVAVKTEAATSDQLLIMFCLIGGFFGSSCSLRWFHPETAFEAGSQFLTNIILSGIASPILVDIIGHYTGWPTGLRLALPVSWAVGLTGCKVVSILIPYGEKILRKNAEAAADAAGGGADVLKNMINARKEQKQ